MRVRVSPEMAQVMPQIYGERLANAGPPDAEGWLSIELIYETMDGARSELLGLGPDVEVIEPAELRASLIAQAERVLAFYAGRREASGAR